MANQTERSLFRTYGGGVVTWTFSDFEWHLGSIQDKAGEITDEKATLQEELSRTRLLMHLVSPSSKVQRPVWNLLESDC